MRAAMLAVICAAALLVPVMASAQHEHADEATDLGRVGTVHFPVWLSRLPSWM